MIVDASALLALLFDESSAGRIEEILETERDQLQMSTVNLAETLIVAQSRQPKLFETLRERIFATTIRFVPPTVPQAELAARSRLKYPLNLGDCFCYALAMEVAQPILTVDRDFLKTDAQVVVP